jgi:hypothetical protein
MAIAVINSRSTLATYYGTQATWIGLAATTPGTGTTPSTEISGGSPAYARVQTTWGAASSGVITGSAVTINVPTTTTVTYAILASAALVASANMFDNCTVTSTTYNAQGSAVVTPTFTIT